MSDEPLRELERTWGASGLVADEAALLRERVRVGDLDADQLALAAYCLYPAAREALGDDAPEVVDYAELWAGRIELWRREPHSPERLRELAGERYATTWIEGLARWGKPVIVRMCVAVTEYVLPRLTRGSEEAEQVLALIRAWLREPSWKNERPLRDFRVPDELRRTDTSGLIMGAAKAAWISEPNPLSVAFFLRCASWLIEPLEVSGSLAEPGPCLDFRDELREVAQAALITRALESRPTEEREPRAVLAIRERAAELYPDWDPLEQRGLDPLLAILAEQDDVLALVEAGKSGALWEPGQLLGDLDFQGLALWAPKVIEIDQTDWIPLVVFRRWTEGAAWLHRAASSQLSGALDAGQRCEGYLRPRKKPGGGVMGLMPAQKKRPPPPTPKGPGARTPKGYAAVYDARRSLNLPWREGTMQLQLSRGAFTSNAVTVHLRRGALPADAASVEDCVAALTSPNLAGRAGAVDALQKLGAEAVPALLPLLEDPWCDAHGRVLQVLRGLGPQAAGAVDVLLRLPSHACLAADELPETLASLGPEAVDAIRRAALVEGGELRERAQAALALLERGGEG